MVAAFIDSGYLIVVVHSTVVLVIVVGQLACRDHWLRIVVEDERLKSEDSMIDVSAFTVLFWWQEGHQSVQNLCHLYLLVNVLHPTQHNIGHFGDVPKPISWLDMEKLSLTQQKLTFTNQKKRNTTQNKHEKLKPDLVTSYDIRPGNGEGLLWFQCFINLSLTYLLRHLPTCSPGPTWGTYP